MGRETRFLRVLGLVTRNIGRNRVSEVLLQSAEADFVCVAAVSTAVLSLPVSRHQRVGAWSTAPSFQPYVLSLPVSRHLLNFVDRSPKIEIILYNTRVNMIIHLNKTLENACKPTFSSNSLHPNSGLRV